MPPGIRVVGPAPDVLQGQGFVSTFPRATEPAFWFAVYVILSLVIIGVLHFGFRGAVQS